MDLLTFFFDLSTICFGFVDKMFWLCGQNVLDLLTDFLDLLTIFFGFVDKIVIDLLMKCFGPEARRGKRRPKVAKGGPKGPKEARRASDRQLSLYCFREGIEKEKKFRTPPNHSV